MVEQLILVDENDKEIGVEEKIKAHQDGGKLHRAFSIFVFNSEGKMILQQRAKIKYHCGGFWTNTCCGHPRPNESTEDAVHRRLQEEMGFDCELEEVFSFTYKVGFKNGLTEWEFDHVFIGTYDGQITPNSDEAEGWKYTDIGFLKADLMEHPEKYTPWFKIVAERVIKYVEDWK